MIRFVGIAALLSLLVLVLYLPSAHPPERFLAQIRSEHQMMEELWGETPALRIFDRALGLQGAAREATPVPATTGAFDAIGVESAGSREMAAVNKRLFGSRYFRAIDALVLLAALRLSAILEWLPWTGFFGLAAIADGAIERVLKGREFRQHDPERFALFATLAILAACATVVAVVLPVSLALWIMPVVPTGIALLLARSLAHFHRRP